MEQWEATLASEQAEARVRMVATPDATGPQERVLLTDTPIYQQLAPDSSLLKELNTPGMMPSGVECHCFYGDIRVGIAVRWRADGFTLFDWAVSFGDFAVPAHSAENPACPRPRIRTSQSSASI